MRLAGNAGTPRRLLRWPCSRSARPANRLLGAACARACVRWRRTPPSVGQRSGPPCKLLLGRVSPPRKPAHRLRKMALRPRSRSGPNPAVIAELFGLFPNVWPRAGVDARGATASSAVHGQRAQIPQWSGSAPVRTPRHRPMALGASWRGSNVRLAVPIGSLGAAGTPHLLRPRPDQRFLQRYTAPGRSRGAFQYSPVANGYPSRRQRASGCNNRCRHRQQRPLLLKHAIAVSSHHAQPLAAQFRQDRCALLSEIRPLLGLTYRAAF